MKNVHLFNNIACRLWAATGLVAGFSTAFVAFSLPETAHAQQGSAGALLEEIVTVARKRSDAEAVQDVPIAISAFGSQQIDALFVTKLDDLSYMMPNVQLEAVGTFPGVQNFSIRGQGINSSIPSVDPTVGVFVDGVYLGTTFGVVMDTFDLESIEVLRGPQGLLFGRNVTGGAALLRTKRPDGEFATRVRVTGTDEDEYGVAASIEGSLIDDELFAKFTAYYNNDDGYFKNNNQQTALPAPVPGAFYYNPATGRNVGAMQTSFARPTIVWRPTDDQQWTLILESGKSDGDGASWANVTAQNAGALDYFTTTQDEMGRTDIKWDQATLETKIAEFGDGTITNIFGWREVRVESAGDIDGTELPIFSAEGDSEQNQVSNELRWSGSFNPYWDATLGMYYFTQEIVYREGRVIQGGAVTLALGGNMEATNFGLFWNNDFRLGNGFTAQLGVRFTDESKRASIFTAGCFDIVTYSCNSNDFDGDWSNWTPKIGFTQELGENAMAYGFWTKGFRSGGFNFRNARPDVIPPGPTDEEETNSYEIGIKSELADGRVRLNVAAFYNEISDIQRELNLPDPFVVVLQGTINAGDVVIDGIEVDLVALITEHFSINASAGFQDGRYTRVNPDFASFLGSDLPRLAPGNGSFGFSWDIPMGAGVVNLAGMYAYRAQNFYNDSNTEFFEEQERIDASINYYSPGDRWRFSLYGKNLGDDPNWGNLTSIAGLFTAGPMQRGRIVGLQVDYQYH